MVAEVVVVRLRKQMSRWSVANFESGELAPPQLSHLPVASRGFENVSQHSLPHSLRA